MSSVRLQEILAEAVAEGEIATLILDGNEGLIVAGGGKNIFDSDGSGRLANGNIFWDAMGNLSINGYFQSNGSGNRIIIDPVSREMKMIDSNNNILGVWHFAHGGSRIDLYDTTEDENSYSAWLGIRHKNRNALLESGYLEITRDNGSRFSVDTFRDNREGHISVMMKNLPTSSKNLMSGEVWRDGEVLKIVP